MNIELADNLPESQRHKPLGQTMHRTLQSRRHIHASARLRARILLCAIVLCLPTVSSAYHTPNRRATMQQQFLGNRTFHPSFDYVGDVFVNITGGLKQEAGYLHVLSASVHVNLDSLLGMHGTSLYFSGFWSVGDTPLDYVGNFQGIDNIAAPTSLKLFNAQLRQSLFDYRLSLLFGLLDLNSEFDVTPAATLFLSPSFGIGAAFGQSGINGPSIYPTTSLAFRIASYLPSDMIVRVGAFDGIPGDPGRPFGTHVELSDGALLVGEIARRDLLADDSKFGIGFWTYTTPRDGILYRTLGEPAGKRGRDRGMYLIAEYPIYPGGGEDHQISLFGQLGLANARINRLSTYVGFGVTLDGYLGDDGDNSIGLGVATAFNGHDYKEAQHILGNPVNDAEILIETTVRFPLWRFIDLQPDVQYVINPNTDPAIPNALIAFLRLEATL